MLPARGVDAIWEVKGPDDKVRNVSQRVLFWDADGDGLVLHEKRGLIYVSEWSGREFVGYSADRPATVGVLPAQPGTLAVFWTYENPNDVWYEVVIGWIVGEDGAACPIYRAEPGSPVFASDETVLRAVQLPGESLHQCTARDFGQ